MSKKKNNDYDLNSIDKLIDNTFIRLKEIVDANTMVGSTIKLNDNLFIIPISKVSVGLISGGGEIPKNKKNSMSVGSSTGFTIVPMGFITINNTGIDFVGTSTPENSTGRILEAFMSIYEKYLNKAGNNYEE